MDREVDESLIVRYLLRDSNDVELCDDEFQQIELRYLADQDFIQQVVAIEDELIQSYVNGELPTEEKLRFERSYLNDPAKSKKLRFSRTLKGWFDTEQK
jgi:uncharacterized membrane protein YebE (DUF533 family)